MLVMGILAGVVVGVLAIRAMVWVMYRVVVGKD